MSADGEGHRKLECSVICTLAGPSAQRRASGLDDRHRLAIHEAGHSVVGARVGLYVGEISIDAPPEVKRGDGRRRYAAGYASISLHPLPADLPKRPWPKLVPDHQAAAKYASVLAPVAGWPASWRGTLGYLRQLQGITRKLVDENWERIETVAAALLEFGELRREEVEALMNQNTGAEHELLGLIAAYRASIGGDLNHADRRVLAALAGSVMTEMITGQWRSGRNASWVRTQSIAASAAVGNSLGMRVQEISVAGDDTSLVGRCRFESDQRVDRPDGRDVPDIGELRRDLPRLGERARGLVLADWCAIQGLAEALRQRTTLTGVEAERIVDEARRELARHVPTVAAVAEGAAGDGNEGMEYADSAVA